MATPGPGARFLTLVDVAEVLNTSSAQVYALVRGGDLPAIKIGGRGQWRVESSELEKYIQRMYEQTRDFVSTHRFGRPGRTRTRTSRAVPIPRASASDPASNGECRRPGMQWRRGRW